MRILLVDPPQVFLEGNGTTRQIHPLGIATIGAVLASEHDVRFLLPDTKVFKGDHPWDEIAEAVREEAPDVVGITTISATFHSAKKLADVVKTIDPQIQTVLGGVHPTVEPLQTLKDASAVDFVVRGEGEHTLLELVRALDGVATGNRFQPEVIPGLVWRDESGEIRMSLRRPAITDLDSLPIPLRQNLVWPEDIQSTFYQGMITQRGCPFRCIYCARPSANERGIRYRSPENVVEEMAHLKERHDVPSVFLHDSVFTVNRDRVMAICQLKLDRELHIPFYCQTRADLVDAELLDHMAEAGCGRVMFGIESGDAESLKRIGKGMTLETIVDAVGMVNEREIRCTGFFMVGFPWETRQLMTQTVDFAISLGLDSVSLFSATPLVGTELYRMVGGVSIPESVDFRTAQVNLTQLPDEQYVELFAELSARIDAYNQAEMYKGISFDGTPSVPNVREWHERLYFSSVLRFSMTPGCGQPSPVSHTFTVWPVSFVMLPTYTCSSSMLRWDHPNPSMESTPSSQAWMNTCR